METIYEVRTPEFEGPLSLLLELIEKRKFFVNDISLARIADDYVIYVKGRADIPLEHIAEFINTASILLLIKSRSLLPNLKLSDEEEKDIEDLEERLRTLREIKELGIYIGKRFGKHIIFLPEDSRDPKSVFSPHPGISVESLLSAARTIISGLPKFKQEKPKAKIVKVVSLDEMISRLAERVKDAVRMSFRDFSKSNGANGEREKKLHTVIGFLAILELFKRGIVELIQEKEFSDIEIESVEIGVPRY